MIIEMIADIVAALSANSNFANAGVVGLNEKDPGNTVDAYLARTGLGVIVGTTKPGAPSADIQGNGSVYFDNIEIHVTIFENVLVNRSTAGNLWAPQLAEAACCVLHWYKSPNLTPIQTYIVAQGPTIIPWDKSADANGRELLIYDMAVKTQGGITLTTQMNTIATPTVTVTNNGDGTSSVTLATTTPYAQIWYTTDGKQPAPLDATNSPRAPYTAPFNVTNGSTNLKVRAWLAGYLPSALVSQNI